MDFIKELQHFVSSLGFRRIQVEGGLLWMKEAEGRLRLIEVIPELLPGQTRVPVSRQEERILHLENQLMIRFGEKTDRLTLMECLMKRRWKRSHRIRISGVLTKAVADC